MGTEETALSVYIELRPFCSEFARHMKGARDLLEDIFVSENRVWLEVVLIRLKSALDTSCWPTHRKFQSIPVFQVDYRLVSLSERSDRGVLAGIFDFVAD